LKRARIGDSLNLLNIMTIEVECFLYF